MYSTFLRRVVEKVFGVRTGKAVGLRIVLERVVVSCKESTNFLANVKGFFQFYQIMEFVGDLK